MCVCVCVCVCVYIPGIISLSPAQFCQKQFKFYFRPKPTSVPMVSRHKYRHGSLGHQLSNFSDEMPTCLLYLHREALDPQHQGGLQHPAQAGHQTRAHGPAWRSRESLNDNFDYYSNVIVNNSLILCITEAMMVVITSLKANPNVGQSVGMHLTFSNTH